MTQPRNRLVSIDDTPYYHCIGRCVRRSFLCGQDKLSGKNYTHRRQWVVDRLEYLTSLFAINVCSYAVMSNHYHVVLKLNPGSAKDWTDKEIVLRWEMLFSGNEHTRAYLSDEDLTDNNKDYLSIQIPIWRERLLNISWFMRCLNENIARRANAEDGCTGRFWEGRFKSQALLDETALVSCMAYVDLNPIRAKMAKSPEESEYTSIQSRIRELVKGNTKSNQQNNQTVQHWLAPMSGQSNNSECLPIDLDNYLALVDWTGRAQQHNKRSSIPNHLSPILKRLEFNQSDWLKSQQGFGKRYTLTIGTSIRIKALATRVGRCWLSGQGKSEQFGFR